MGNRSWTGKQSVPETGSGSPRSLCSGVAGLASLGRPADVALLGYLDSDVQDQTQCFQEPPIVPGPSTDQEVPMGGPAQDRCYPTTEQVTGRQPQSPRCLERKLIFSGDSQPGTLFIGGKSERLVLYQMSHQRERETETVNRD